MAKERVLILRRKYLLESYKDEPIQSINYTMFNSGLFNRVRKSHKVIFRDNNQELVLKNRFGQNTIINDLRKISK